jgi:hypothetical protein
MVTFVQVPELITRSVDDSQPLALPTIIVGRSLCPLATGTTYGQSYSVCFGCGLGDCLQKVRDIIERRNDPAHVKEAQRTRLWWCRQV